MALTSDGFGMNDMHDMAKHIRDIIYGVKGIKKIDLFGVQEERIYLKIESTKLAELGINPSQISACRLQLQQSIFKLIGVQHKARIRVKLADGTEKRHE